MKYTINYIRDYQTGIEFTSNNLLLKYDNDHRERSVIRRELYKATKDNEEKQLVCSICNHSLKLSGGIGTKQKLHFRHYQDHIGCPITTSENKTQKEIDAIRYNGAKESERHLKLKQFIYNQLIRDNRFQQSAMEKVVKILKEKKSWRRPDVSSIFENKKIVFEVQLQTTYLNVIVDREEDYKSEKTYIMWFFDNNVNEFRFSEEDIFYANKSNAFVITNETMIESFRQNKFLFECCYKIPFIKNNRIYEKWESEIISFYDLKFDKNNYKVYYYDFDRERNKLEQQNRIRSSLIKIERFNNIDDWKILENDLKPLFKKYNVIDNHKVIRTIIILYSIKKQKLYGWETHTLIWALNDLFESHIEYFHLIIKMIDENKLGDKIREQDRNKTFAKKANPWREKRNKNIEENKYNNLFITLFPELGNKIQKQIII